MKWEHWPEISQYNLEKESFANLQIPFSQGFDRFGSVWFTTNQDWYRENQYRFTVFRNFVVSNNKIAKFVPYSPQKHVITSGYWQWLDYPI